MKNDRCEFRISNELLNSFDKVLEQEKKTRTAVLCDFIEVYVQDYYRNYVESTPSKTSNVSTYVHKENIHKEVVLPSPPPSYPAEFEQYYKDTLQAYVRQKFDVTKEEIFEIWSKNKKTS